jgi:hypothetical protein
VDLPSPRFGGKLSGKSLLETKSAKFWLKPFFDSFIAPLAKAKTAMNEDIKPYSDLKISLPSHLWGGKG